MAEFRDRLRFWSTALKAGRVPSMFYGLRGVSPRSNQPVVAANNQSFIDSVLVDRENAFHFVDELETLRRSVTDMFEPLDDSGLLYAHRPIDLHPKRSH